MSSPQPPVINLIVNFQPNPDGLMKCVLQVGGHPDASFEAAAPGVHEKAARKLKSLTNGLWHVEPGDWVGPKGEQFTLLSPAAVHYRGYDITFYLLLPDKAERETVHLRGLSKDQAEGWINRVGSGVGMVPLPSADAGPLHGRMIPLRYVVELHVENRFRVIPLV